MSFSIDSMCRRRIGGIAMAVVALMLADSALAARADAMELDDTERAEVAKETLKGKRAGMQGTDRMGAMGSGQNGAGSNNKSCGSVDIGNDSSARGSERIADRKKTVIVTGNVYNTANCKR